MNTENGCEDRLEMRNDRVLQQDDGGETAKDPRGRRQKGHEEERRKEISERKDTGREKVRRREEKCSGRGGIYGRVSSAQQGCLLKGSLIRSGRERRRRYKDG